MSDKQWKKAQTDDKADKQLKKAIEILKKIRIGFSSQSMFEKLFL